MTAALPFKCVGICGTGQMGAAAAVSCQRAGYEVLLWARDPSPRKRDAVRGKLDELNAWLDRHVGSAPGNAPGTGAGTAATPAAIEIVSDLAAIDGRADLIIDAIAEVMEQKVELFRRLGGALARGAVFATTTSGLSITEMGRAAGCGRRLVGTHFWNPPHLMPLVEVIRGQDTAPELMDQVCRFVESLGKIPVRVNRDVPGFIGNRLLHALWREAIDLVRQGVASPADIDRVARLTFGLRLPAVGPLENMDLVGLDLIHTIHQYLLADLADDKRPNEALAQRVHEGKLGMKSGAGFYDWKQRDPAALIERRDRQIVQQLRFLKEIDAL